MKIEELKESFKNYVYNFNMEDEQIALKFHHSNRVMDLCILNIIILMKMIIT